MEILRGLLENMETEVVETLLGESPSLGGNSLEMGTGVEGEFMTCRFPLVFC